MRPGSLVHKDGVDVDDVVCPSALHSCEPRTLQQRHHCCILILARPVQLHHQHLDLQASTLHAPVNPCINPEQPSDCKPCHMAIWWSLLPAPCPPLTARFASQTTGPQQGGLGLTVPGWDLAQACTSLCLEHVLGSWWELPVLTCRREKSTVRSTSSSAPSTSRLHRSMEPTPVLQGSEAGTRLGSQRQAVNRQLPAMSSEPAPNLKASLRGRRVGGRGTTGGIRQPEGIRHVSQSGPGGRQALIMARLWD